MVLRLRNNFVVAIQVSTQVSAYDEAQIQVSHRINRHESLLLLLAPGPDPEPAPRWIGPPKERVESDVYATESIPSGADLLFEVPSGSCRPNLVSGGTLQVRYSGRTGAAALWRCGIHMGRRS